ncbi:MAG: single-stranded DNA-binding protein [Candidatus Coproplasma sp.]
MNKVFLTGNLTRDPELSETSSGVQICRFSIAVNRNYTNSEGERKSDFFNCISWKNTAVAVSRYSHKGDKLNVIGSIETRIFEDKDGIKRSATEIQVQEVEFLTPRTAGSGGSEKVSTVTQPAARTQLMAFDDGGDIPF